MIELAQVVEDLLGELEGATGVSVRVGWRTEQDAYPLITLLMLDAGVEWASLDSRRFIYRLRFQIDIWHFSAEECDRLATRITARLAEWAYSRGYMGFRVESMRDVPSEEVYRKTVEVGFSLIG
ncbi:MAG: hypothetical protein QXQ48_07350 [Nitrososphaerota archaeon]